MGEYGWIPALLSARGRDSRQEKLRREAVAWTKACTDPSGLGGRITTSLLGKEAHPAQTSSCRLPSTRMFSTSAYQPAQGPRETGLSAMIRPTAEQQRAEMETQQMMEMVMAETHISKRPACAIPILISRALELLATALVMLMSMLAKKCVWMTTNAKL